MESITFLVHGTAAASRSAGAPPQASASFPFGTVKQSVRIGVLRGADSMVPVAAVPGQDVVVLHVENGPSLVLHPENARDLFMAQAGTLDAEPHIQASGRGATRAASQRPLLRVPATLGWANTNAPGVQRGIVDKVVLTAIEVLTGFSVGKVADAASLAVVAAVDDQVDPGVYKLQSSALTKLKGNATPLAAVPAVGDGKPLLVLVHGTFSNTEGTFGKLWTEHPTRVIDLFERYDGNVYALEHPTLGVSPISNALRLAEKLPKGTCLHLLTHSRGGLVAEVLARAASLAALTREDKSIFAGKNYADQLADLQTLVAMLKEKDIRVERVVRVACPARGTLLASKRLDAYLSVFKWLLERAQIPVLPALVEFLGDVARNKSDPAHIPGLAAQMPDSPLVKWLHAAPAPVQGQLRVVAGDVEADSVMSWIKTLLADSFYWTDNDFVVQTSSMYGGAPRAEGATFLLNRGGEVSHFSYFANASTAEAVVSALTRDVPDGFRVIGPLSAAGQDTSGARGTITPPNPARPAVFVLPGILGSNLQLDGKRIWLGWGMVNGLHKLAYDPALDKVEPDGPIELVYSKLCKFLAATHDVIEFAFDWRKPIEQEAERLAAGVALELDRREASGQPVRLLAHSMGGIVARVMQLRRPDVWQRMMARPGARLLMLGTPNGGSWAPMQVLSGDDSFGNALVAFGAPFQDGQARALMATFPGFLQLQAGLLDTGTGLGSSARWAELAAKDMQIVKAKTFWHNLEIQLSSFEWGLPSQPVLNQAVSLRRALDAQRDRLAGGDALVMVLGRAKFTPAGYQYGNDGLVYLDAPAYGDGRVTLDAALLPRVPAWQIDCEHGSMPADEQSFGAYLDLLQSGTTERLGPQLDPAASGTVNRAAWVPNRAARSAPAVAPDALGWLSSEPVPPRTTEARRPPLVVTVVNGNIKYVRQPMMIGHYQSLQLFGAESVMDKMIGGGMSESIRMGYYPQALRDTQVFLNLGANASNPLQMPRPEAVIVVGLGHEGELKAGQLSLTVCQGVLAWAQRRAESHLVQPQAFELAATLIGSGGSSMSAGLAARAIAKGVSDANRSLGASKWPVVSHLRLIEVYLDRATEAWRSLGLLAASARAAYKVSERIESAPGALRQALDTGYRGASYDLLAARTRDDRNGTLSIEYTLDTKRAREDVRTQPLQAPLVEKLVESASNAAEHDPQLGFTLFKLLVPPEMEPFMGGTSDMQIQLDKGTLGIPWELLNTHAGTRRDSDPEPWAIRVKLLRSLRTMDFAAAVQDAGSHHHILVIGEPDCAPRFPRLPGAREEAIAVHDTLALAGLGDKVKTLVSADPQRRGPNASKVVSTLLEREWRIIHIAGHGVPASDDKYGGVVLSDDLYFGPIEVATMRVVPSLVFVNCCYLGATDPSALLKEEDRPQPYNRARFAAGIAEQLIKKGVRCVIAAGWTVNDTAAKTFAETFYKALAGNNRFIDAVAAARRAAYDPKDNTWAAYQCYGDPDWRLQTSADPVDRVRMSLAEEFANVCSAPSLVLALESIITRTRFDDFPHQDSAVQVLYLQQRFEKQWGGVGAVAEAFGIAWAEARELDRAIGWHERARDASDGTASLRSVEQLGSLLARTAWESVRNIRDDLPPTPTAAQQATLNAAIRKANETLLGGLAMLTQLDTIHSTPERASLCASAYKRKAMLEQLRGKRNEVALALKGMERHYDKAAQAARAAGSPDWYYPALNRLAAALIRQLGNGAWQPDPAEVAAIRRCIEDKVNADADFYSVVAATELDFYIALAGRAVVAQQGTVLAQFDDLYRRVQGPRWWNSVRDQFEFVVSQCDGVLAPDDRLACERITDRLAQIAPRSRTPQPERVWREFLAFA